MLFPPSATISAPTKYEESVLARKNTDLAIFSAVPKRFTSAREADMSDQMVDRMGANVPDVGFCIFDDENQCSQARPVYSSTEPAADSGWSDVARAPNAFTIPQV